MILWKIGNPRNQFLQTIMLHNTEKQLGIFEDMLDAVLIFKMEVTQISCKASVKIGTLSVHPQVCTMRPGSPISARARFRSAKMKRY